MEKHAGAKSGGRRLNSCLMAACEQTGQKRAEPRPASGPAEEASGEVCPGIHPSGTGSGNRLSAQGRPLTNCRHTRHRRARPPYLHSTYIPEALCHESVTFRDMLGNHWGPVHPAPSPPALPLSCSVPMGTVKVFHIKPFGHILTACYCQGVKYPTAGWMAAEPSAGFAAA